MEMIPTYWNDSAAYLANLNEFIAFVKERLWSRPYFVIKPIRGRSFSMLFRDLLCKYVKIVCVVSCDPVCVSSRRYRYVFYAS